MVKKKEKQSAIRDQQLADGASTVPMNTSAPLSAEYEIGQWAGRAHYRCKLCAFDVLDSEEKMVEHIQLRHHPRPAPRRAPSVLVADKRGNDVSNQVASENDGDLNHVFEVELKEIDSTIDEQGNEHKTFTIKE